MTLFHFCCETSENHIPGSYLESFVKDQEPWDMNMEEKIEVAGKKKEEGNAPFKADEYAKASKRYEKGCRPYMCEASYRHSNCLDQFHKSLSKSPSTVLLQEEMPPSDTQSSPMATSEAMGRISASWDEYYAWGLHQIAKVVSFLNEDCKRIHGNVCLTNVLSLKI
ncbi:unnamed protein product, partial [Vitis vinifera]